MSQTQRIRQTSINALTNYLRFFFTMVVSFWLIPFIIKSLGQEMYGLWTLSFSIIGFFSLLDFGFGLGVVKWTGETRISGNLEYRNHMLSTVFFVYIAIATAAILFLGVFSLFYARIFSIPQQLQPIAVTVLLILGIRSLMIQIPMSLFKGVLFGEQRIYLINIIQIAGTIIYAFTAYLALSQGLGVVWLAVINCSSFFLENLLYLIMAYSKVKGLSLSIRKVKKQYLKEAMSFSLYSFITSVAGLVLFQTDVIIIQLTLNLSLVGLYSVAIKITEYSFLLTKQLVNVLTPLISELKESKEDDSIRFLLTGLSKYILATGVILTTTIYVFGQELLVFWVGNAFIEATLPLLILMTSFMLTIPELIASSVLTMTGNHTYTARISVLSIIVNIGVSLLLVRPLGLTGIALGTLTSTVVNNVGLTLYKVSRVYKFSYFRYITRVYAPALLPSIALIGIGLGMKYFFSVHSVWDMMLKAIPGVVVYVVIFWILFMDKQMKQKILNKVLKRSV